MRSPWLRLIVSFVTIASVFAGYRLLATPHLEPPRRSSDDLSTVRFSGPLKSVQRMPELARWFKSDAWELAYPQILETEYGVLLLKSYKTLDDGRLLIEPCTLVLKAAADESTPDEAPIILQSPAGAILAFDRPLDLRKAKVGKLVSGLLQGDIHIRRSGTPTSPPLDLYTRNVQIDESRIWTTQDVRFQYGQTHGSGRDLLITLPKFKPGAAKPTKSNQAPIRFMELVHVDRIHVDLDALQHQPTGEPKTTLAQPPTNPLLSKQSPRSLDIECDGPFRIDFLQQAAAFEKNVRLTLNHDGPQVDRLHCNLLAAYFALNKSTARSAASPEQSSPLAGVSTGNFQLKRVVATGSPVTLDAPNYMAGLEAQRLEYDFEQRLLILGDSQSVRLQHERFEVNAQGGIEYQFPKQGKLGDLWAGGPGEFSGQISPDSEDRLIATWGERLQMHRQGEHQLLSLEGGASVGMRNFGGVRATNLHLWLKPATQSRTARSRSTSTQPNFSYQADRMLAEEDVIIQSPMFSGEVARLEAWFRDAPQRLPDPNAANLAGALRRTPDPYNGDLNSAHQQPRTSATENTTPKQSYHLAGRQARVHFLRAGEDYLVDEVAVEGGVDLREVGATVDQLPLRVSGELLVLKHAQAENATLRMLGNPAQLVGRGMTIRGGEVIVDRAANTIEIPAPGHLQLPLSAELPLMAFASTANPAARQPQTAGPPPAAARPAQPPQLLNVTWQKGCLFDGRTARFTDQVEIGSAAQVASADLLSVTLDRPLDFQQASSLDKAPGRTSGQPQVESVRLEGNVRIEQQERDPQGQLTSIQRAALPMLQVNQLTGEITSDGAGWFETVRYGSSLAQQASTQNGYRQGANRPAASGTAELIHLKVHYAQGIRGDLRSKQVRCFDQVQAIYGPVADWDQRLDLWRQETHGSKTIIMQCDQLQAAAMGVAEKQAFEMTALGNTTVQGKLFTATCHRISYDGTKELLVMEGDGRRDAEVTQRTRPGGQQSQAAARQIFFSLRDQSFHVNDAKYLDLSGPFATGGF